MMKSAAILAVAMLAVAQGFVAPMQGRSSTIMMAEPKKAANASFSYMDNLNTKTKETADKVASKAEDVADDAKKSGKKAANASFSYMDNLSSKTAEAAEAVKEKAEEVVDEVAAAGKKVGHYLDQ